MTTVDVSDAAVAARIAAWLRVGGSWAAIAAAHGATDPVAFEREWAPRVEALRARGRSRAPHKARSAVQLTLFTVADRGVG